GSNIGQRIQHEVSLRDAWMRNSEIRLFHPHVAVCEQIEIDAPGPPTLDWRRTPERHLELFERDQELARRKPRQHADRRIDEIRLHDRAERSRAVDTRARNQTRRL